MPSLTRAKRGDTTAIRPCEPKGGRRPEKYCPIMWAPEWTNKQTNKEREREREREREWRRRLETRKSEGDSDGIIIDYYS